MFVCFFNETATTKIYTYRHTLSLHDALPICRRADPYHQGRPAKDSLSAASAARSYGLVCGRGSRPDRPPCPPFRPGLSRADQSPAERAWPGYDEKNTDGQARGRFRGCENKTESGCEGEEVVRTGRSRWVREI